MKKLTIMTMAILVSSFLVACGGGGATSSGGGGNGGGNPSVKSDSLIIDNGRGTVNNQDTERPD